MNQVKKFMQTHDLFIQQMKMKNTLRKIMKVEPVSHIDYDPELITDTQNI